MSAAEHDLRPLRSFVEMQFSAMSRGVQTNAEIALVVEKLIRVAKLAVLDCAASWNNRFAAIKLPDELLATCFALLPFRDRFAASQVSRAWRRGALTFPTVWSHIELLDNARGFDSLFNLALARAGCIPVDIECSGYWYIGEKSAEIRNVINRHSHHLRSLTWRIPYPLPECLSSTDPALLLESLDTDRDLELSHNFLGGKRSNLLSLHVHVLSLPASCPAISTLTRLSCNVPAQPGAAWRRLFDLCPRLEELTLRLPRSVMPHSLPTGPAPPTLLKLELVAGEFDMAALCIAWRTERLTDVAIYASSPAGVLTACHPGVVRLCSEAVHLDISLYAGKQRFGSLTLRLATPASTKCVITLEAGHVEHVDSFETLIRVLPLDNLRSLSIDGTLLAVFLERPPRHLTHLKLHMRRGKYQRNTAPYQWRSLPDTPPSLPELQTVCFAVDPPTNAGDGRQLLEVLIELSRTFPALTVDARDLPRHIVDEIRNDRRAEEIRCLAVAQRLHRDVAVKF